MAPKHDEIVRHKSDGWIVAWDTNTVEPATREAFDGVIASNTKALREVVRASQAVQPASRTSAARPRRTRRTRAAA
jgi:ferric-dicitrate binding protein FerR (iron transport regulator)